jgi:hypothetical protein
VLSEGATSSVQPLLDPAGRRRSPESMPGFGNGMAPRKKGSCRRRHDPLLRGGRPTWKLERVTGERWRPVQSDSGRDSLTSSSGRRSTTDAMLTSCWSASATSDKPSFGGPAPTLGRTRARGLCHALPHYDHGRAQLVVSTCITKDPRHRRPEARFCRSPRESSEVPGRRSRTQP